MRARVPRGSWPETPPIELHDMREANGKWVRSQQVAKALRERASDYRASGMMDVATAFECAADDVEEGAI